MGLPALRAVQQPMRRSPPPTFTPRPSSPACAPLLASRCERDWVFNWIDRALHPPHCPPLMFPSDVPSPNFFTTHLTSAQSLDLGGNGLERLHEGVAELRCRESASLRFYLIASANP